MALGNTEMILSERKTVREGEVEISERAFNLLIGGVLLWGFGLNYLTVALFGERVVRLLSGMNHSPNQFIILHHSKSSFQRALPYVQKSGGHIRPASYTPHTVFPEHIRKARMV